MHHEDRVETSLFANIANKLHPLVTAPAAARLIMWAGLVLFCTPLASAQVFTIGHIGSNNQVTEGGASLIQFDVVLTPAAAGPTSVDVSTSSGSAIEGVDYSGSSFTLNFIAGQTIAPVLITTTADVLIEGDETFNIAISNPTGGTTVGAPSSDIGVIVDDEVPAVITIGHIGSQNTVDESVAGSTFALFDVVLTPAADNPVSVQVSTSNGSATAGSDYTSFGPVVVTFNPGITLIPINVGILDDALDEATENFTVSIASPTGPATLGTSSDSGFITDDDPLPSLTVDDVVVVEGDAGITLATFTITLSAASGQTVTVNFATANGTATTANNDYVALAPGSIATFAPGVTTQTVDVLVVGDNNPEPNETFFVNLSGASNASIADSQGQGTINNDDGSLPGLTLGDATVAEGNAGITNATFPVTLSAASGLIVTVNFATTDVTATTADNDYVATSGVVTFNPGVVSQNLTVPVNGDTKFEFNETFRVDLSAPSGASITDGFGSGTINNDDATPQISVTDIAVTEGNAGTINASFAISLSNPSSLPVSVQFNTSDGSATIADNDYVGAAGTVNFTAGTTLQAVQVAVNGDTKFEGNETFDLLLTSPLNATILDGTAIGTINNDDGAPQISINDDTVVEGNAGTTPAVFNVTLSNPSGFVTTVNFNTANGTATLADNDYVANSGTLTFVPGNTSQLVSVNVNGDLNTEADETFFVNLSGAGGGSLLDAQGLGTITNDDAVPQISIGDVVLAEGNAGTSTAAFAVTLSNPSGSPVTVAFATADGSATTADGDYLNAAGTATFNPGVVLQTVNVTINGDTTFEANETFTVNLSAPVGATIADGLGLGTINNDDGLPQISVGDVVLAEGNAGTSTAAFAVTLSNPSGSPVTVAFATADGSATTADGDYLNATGTATFNPRVVLQTVNVTINSDTTFEANETFTVNLSAPVGATIADGLGLGTINNDDGAPQISIGDVTLTEGNAGTSVAAFAVTMSNPSSQGVSFTFATSDGSATTADGDYALTTGTVTFNPGVVSQTINVNVTGDLTFEGDETFTVDATSVPANATLLDAQGLGTIQNDDGQPQISINDVLVIEGNAGTITAVFSITLSNPSSQAVSVLATAADGTATTADGDYLPNFLGITMAPGVTSTPFNVTVNGDTTFEGDEAFNVNLTGAVNATLLDNQGLGTIQNDDGQPQIQINDVSLAEGNAGLSGLLFNVTLSNPSAVPVMVNFATADGTATTADGDYQATTGTVTFTPGAVVQQIPVQLVGDPTFEGDEGFVVDLSAPIGAALADPQGAGTILNDDGVPSMAIDDVSLSEGDAGSSNLSFTVSLTLASSQPVTVDFASADATATLADGDYGAVSGNLTFNPGEVAITVDVPINGDTTFENDETLTVNLSNILGATLGDAQGLGTLLNDDGQPQASIDDVNLAEGNAGSADAVFTVSLSNPSAQTLTLDFLTSDGSATVADNDYQSTSGTLTFNPGEIAQQILVPINGDPTFEGDETFTVDLTTPSGVTIVDAQGIATVLNDDSVPSISITGVTLAEGDSGQTVASFTVALTLASSQTVTVDFTTNDGSATVADNDYLAVTGLLTFNPGEVAGTIDVPVLGDPRFENDEVFTVDLSNPNGASLGVAQASGTISNDDPLPGLSVDDVFIAEGDAGTSSATFTLSLSNPSSQPVAVSFATNDGTATLADGDYQATSGSSNLAADQTTATVVVTINSDVTFEGNETFTVDLSAPSGATLADPQGLGTILNDDGVPALTLDDVLLSEGDSGQTLATFTVALTTPSSQTVTVDFTTVDGTATVADSDYQAASGDLTFAPGTLNATFDVAINGDQRFEPDEGFTTELSNVINGTLGDPMGSATITNDEPQPGLSIDDIRFAEGDAGPTRSTFTVSLSGASAQPVMVTWATGDGTAQVADADYISAAGNLTFAADVLTQTFDVVARGDQRFEGDETFVVDLSSALGATLDDAQGLATILNDDSAETPTFVIDDVVLQEGDEGSREAVFTITLSSPNNLPFSLDYTTVDGTATAGEDYQAGSGSLTLAASDGSASQTVAVTVNGDTEVEEDETFLVQLSAPSAGATLLGNQGQATIENDDSSDDDGGGGDPLPTLQIDDVSLEEGDSGSRQARFTVTLSTAASQPVRVSFASLDGSATAGSDYQAASGQLTFAPSELTQEVSIEVLGDTEVEKDEVFFVLLTQPTGATLADDRGRATVLNDDSGDDGDGDDGDGSDDPLPTLSISDAASREGNAGRAAAGLTVHLSAPSADTISVSWATRDGSARAGSDYTAASGQLTFPPGQTEAELSVAITGDLEVEKDENFFVDLLSPNGAQLADSEGRVTVLNDDQPLGKLRLRRADPVTEDSGQARIQVERFGSAGRAIAVTARTRPPLPTANSDAQNQSLAQVSEDFQAASDRLSWEVGELGIKELVIDIVDDNRTEQEETLIIELVDPQDATLEEPSEIELRILDDDQPRALEAIGDTEVESRVQEQIELVVRVLGELNRPVAGAAVSWTVQGNAAIIQTDSTGTSNNGIGNGGPNAGDSDDPATAEQEEKEPTILKSDADGLVHLPLLLGDRPGRAMALATLVDSEAEVEAGEASVSFAIAVLGDLGNDDGDPTTEDEDVGSVIDEVCVDAEGVLDEFCDYVFDLDDDDQQEVLDQLTPTDDLAAQSDLTLEVPRVQLRNIAARLATLRGSATRQASEQIAFDIRGEPFRLADLGQINSASGSRLAHSYTAQVKAALVAAGAPAQLSGGAASADPPVALDSAPESNPWGIFVNGRVSIGDRPKLGREEGFDFTSQGITAGADRRVGEHFVLGAAAGYLLTDIDIDNSGGSLDATGYALSLYSSYFRKRFYLEGAATYGWNDYRLERSIDLPRPFLGRSRFTARGNPGSQQISFGFGAGYDFDLGAGRLSGLLRVSYIEAEIDGYSETGAKPFALIIGEQRLTSLLTEAGAEVSYPFSFNGGVLQPSLRASYLHEFADDGRLIRASLVADPAGSEFQVSTDDPDRSFFNFAIGLTAVLPRGKSIFLLYDTDLARDDLNIYNLSTGVRIQF